MFPQNIIWIRNSYKLITFPNISKSTFSTIETLPTGEVLEFRQAGVVISVWWSRWWHSSPSSWQILWSTSPITSILCLVTWAGNSCCFDFVRMILTFIVKISIYFLHFSWVAFSFLLSRASLTIGVKDTVIKFSAIWTRISDLANRVGGLDPGAFLLCLHNRVVDCYLPSMVAAPTEVVEFLPHRYEL